MGEIAKDSNNLYTATCLTAASVATTGSFFPGGHGWQIDKYLGIEERSEVTNSMTPDLQYLMFNAEMSFNAHESEGQDFTAKGKTLFKVPYTGEYYFWLAADTKAEFYIGTTADTI